MCGIAGIVHFDGSPPARAAIQRMTDRLAHRGPDADGVHIADGIALGHRRLSIIDLSPEANQPMWDATGRYAIVFNGEIYNYADVRKAFPDYPFRTHSDSETILAAYAHEGPSCLNRFNGMFALAIWDVREKTLFIARDRFGKKPLYYALTDAGFVFASEVRSILASGLVPRVLATEKLAEFLAYQAPMGPHTLIRGVRQLEAGQYAMIRDRRIEPVTYWTLSLPSVIDVEPEAARKRVRELFLSAVQERLVADVPVGAFLSGGIDSSLIVACMAELQVQPVDTFTVCMPEGQGDESAYAEIVARKYNTRHHPVVIHPDAFLGHLDEIFSDMDSPSGDGPNTWLVSRYTRAAGLRVALSGLGGDEWFAGYSKSLIYDRLLRHQYMLQMPRPVRSLAAFALSRSGASSRQKLARLLKLDQWDLSTIYPVLREVNEAGAIADLLRDAPAADEVRARLRRHLPDARADNRLSQAGIGEYETYTRDVLLRDTDQMSMAHALEVRAPFFDHRLVEYVLSLPDAVKYPHTPKQLLVDAMAPRLPEAISQRPKMGFSLPFAHWLRNDLRTFAAQSIDRLSAHPAFHGDAVRQVWDRFQSGDPGIGWARVWQLVVLGEWIDKNGLEVRV